jgi:HAD superfamily hydrolase (TIGR01509 family)
VNSAADLVAQARVVLLDFDGPICSVFSGYPSVRAVSATLRALEVAGFDIRPEWLSLQDPHRLLREVATEMPGAVGVVEDALTQAEVQAVDAAQITRGVTDLIDQVTGRGQRWAVVSNNSAESIARFCTRKDFARSPSLIVGRAKRDPHLMKPNPFVLHYALEILRRPARDAVFVGDSVSDIQAGRAAGIPTIGYANKPTKSKIFETALADIVIMTMDELLRHDDVRLVDRTKETD